MAVRFRSRSYKHLGALDIDIQMRGEEALYRALWRLDGREADKIFRGAPGAAAKFLRGKIRDKVYLRARRRTGKLKRAVKSRRRSKQGNTYRAVVYMESGTSAKNDAFYWHWVEFGTRHSDAKPFIRPAINQNKHDVPEAMAAYIRARLSKIT